MKQPYTPSVAGSVAPSPRLTIARGSEMVSVMKRERGRMTQALIGLCGLTPLPSQANFVLCRVGGGRDAKAVKLALE